MCQHHKHPSSECGAHLLLARDGCLCTMGAKFDVASLRGCIGVKLGFVDCVAAGHNKPQQDCGRVRVLRVDDEDVADVCDGQL
eukprot:1486611-Rhodomonas_salina.3